MTSSYNKFTGKVFLQAILVTQEGQADKALALLKDIQEYANQNEPGCLSYRILRNGNEFSVFEEYENSAAVKVHNESTQLKAMLAEMQKGTLLASEPRLGAYEEV